MKSQNNPATVPLREIAAVFFRLGSTAFGGPAVHIAMMEEEFVRKRKWLTHEEFLDRLGVTNLIPGPNSTQMAIHIGLKKAGWKGLIVAGFCFILPAAAITLFFAYLYTRYGATPNFEAFFYGIRPVVIALIFAALIRLGKPLMKNKFMVVTILLVAGFELAYGKELLWLFLAGVVGMLWTQRQRFMKNTSRLCSFFVLPVSLVATSGDSLPSVPSLAGLGLFFLKVGSVLYGGGYVLLAFLQGGLVDSRHWLTQKQLLDGIAVGQFTPGPVLSTATFIGYLILGFPGAGIATLGIFFPSFILVLLCSPFVSKLRNSPTAKGFLDGVNAASLGLMLAVGINLGIHTLTGYPSWIIFILAAIVPFIWSLNSVWLILGGALLGYGFHFLI